MKIYTKTGDKGETSFYGGARASKSDIRFEVLGTIDEFNAHLGLLRGIEFVKDLTILEKAQIHMFEIGSEIATVEERMRNKLILFSEKETEKLEQEIDRLEEELSPLKYFVLPGGNLNLGYIHIARTVCRRLERILVLLNTSEELNPAILIYINRMSDFLFVLSRWYAHKIEFVETPWIPENKK